MVKQIILQHELDALIKGLGCLVTPALQLASKCALAGKGISVMCLHVAATRHSLDLTDPHVEHFGIKCSATTVMQVHKCASASGELLGSLDEDLDLLWRGWAHTEVLLDHHSCVAARRFESLLSHDNVVSLTIELLVELRQHCGRLDDLKD